ncbi:glycosyltransferase family 39 protein [Rhodopseudomonas sp. B29]|uniref:glycosyltransferase family 39 protein n=1 Tax=Rhodopseudomonas sp. B29 TaxID=95607 RepID=UPI00034A03AD|nr:glycosyltransferase family 39 protein [Rhodopseudomonas sp. B29]
MPATSPSRFRFAPFERWIAALLDPQRQERTVLLTLAVYTVIWTAYRTISTWPRDLHPDETELYDWSRHLALGNAKHPPLSGWITKAWFTLVPVSDIGFHLLATVNIALTLWIAWRTMRRYMNAEKSLFGLALLTLIPFFNFLALKYNANAVLLPVWAATIYCFLRALESPGALWGALAGLFAGASMLGKYWSIVLVGALGLAALFDPRRGRFFASPAPWLMIIAGGAVLAPHLVWLYDHNFPTFGYAAAHESSGFAANARDTATYLLGSIGYAAAAVIAWAVLLRPSRPALADLIWPLDAPRRTVLIAQVLMVLLPMAVALISGIRIVPLWTMPGWTLLPLVLLTSPLISVSRDTVRSIMAVAAVVSVGALLASPIVALAIHLREPPGPAEYASLLADRIEQEWRTHTDQPIALVAGEPALAGGTAYYLRTDTRAFAGGDSSALAAEITTRGGVLVCPAEDSGCVGRADQIAAGQNPILRGQVWLNRPLFGLAGATRRDIYVLVLPKPSPSR